jgi:phospholipid N-methyltransferase
MMEGHATFFREFLKHPLQIGSIIPSSRFLERRVVDACRIRSAKTIIELGPGSGGTTRAILRAAPPEAKVLCIEVNPNFHELVSRIEDERLIVHLGGAMGLREIISHYGLDAPDVVVSGIPFSTMGNSAGVHIIREISSVLPCGGRFVAYQVSARVAELCRPILGKEEEVEVEFLNIPPMRVYAWKKNGACP